MILRILYSDRRECVLGIPYRLRIRTPTTHGDWIDLGVGKGRGRKPTMISLLESANL